MPARSGHGSLGIHHFAGRLLFKDKWFSAVAAIALALGIGVNATVFTFVNAVLIRGLPIRIRTGMAMVVRRARNRTLGVSYLDFRDWRESTRTFSSCPPTPARPRTSARKASRRSATPASTSPRTRFQFSACGRCSAATSSRRTTPRRAAVALIGHGVWQNRYGGNPSVIGRTVRINDVPTVSSA